ncbi:AAA family ATPase [Pseudonocardia sp. KRD-184]|uniref:AAA family ATPase n=1 Tax=Pseudonocardia oceani TaxID=2792013 RepID=A0ABS6UK24_9PSEU|nr:AAA family ATPase [Pseudonocardia oceani]MBW0088262.1 AAA family ATPase [Pseudonocardia oceani]MBW0095044.1 AAA family ATPase [Pseudonocardia oceani]MBW0121103.1 AAA family ATPase [Pseudonocardia oceani]MBW0131211.1 AAA family ATPase [Pseudonocardia oceani]MBW0132622.1 AAA family ATPase [Pseudonocardia oceani]
MIENLRDHTAERQLLAIALHGRTDELLALAPGAFSHWQHAAIAMAITGLAQRGMPTDPPIVMREVVNAAGGDARAQTMGKLVADLATHLVPGESAGYYVERISALHTARELALAMERFQGKVAYAAENDDDEVLAGAANEAREAIGAAEVAFRPVAAEPPMSLGSLLDEEDDPYDWLVPGLLERTDRLILTGFEGTGKSFLLAQFALCVAAGLHPFTGDPLPEREYRTLVFDCENSKRQMKRRYRRIAAQVDALRRKHDMGPVDWHRAVRIVSRPEGVALTEPRELARIEQNVSLSAPDLVVAGPLYKMSKLDVKDEQAAKELTDTLDLLRVRHQFTLIAEAHAGHSNDGGGARRVRPIGSSLFLRWPEFGFGIAPHRDCATEEHPSMVEVKHWRGSRDERAWPQVLRHGAHLPWEPTGDYFQMLAERGVA